MPTLHMINGKRLTRMRLLTITLGISSQQMLLLCSVSFDPEVIASRLRELAFLNNTATIRFRATSRPKPGSHANGDSVTAAASSSSSEESSSDSSSEDGDVEAVTGNQVSGDNGWQVFHYSAGLLEYVKWVNGDKQGLHQPIVVSREV